MSKYYSQPHTNSFLSLLSEAMKNKISIDCCQSGNKWPRQIFSVWLSRDGYQYLLTNSQTIFFVMTGTNLPYCFPRQFCRGYRLVPAPIAHDSMDPTQCNFDRSCLAFPCARTLTVDHLYLPGRNNLRHEAWVFGDRRHNLMESFASRKNHNWGVEQNHSTWEFYYESI